jgi:hypothetical protein
METNTTKNHGADCKCIKVADLGLSDVVLDLRAVLEEQDTEVDTIEYQPADEQPSVAQAQLDIVMTDRFGSERRFELHVREVSA